MFDNIKNFYNFALKPIGEWVLGQGLPRLLDVGSGLLNSINWSKLSESIKGLWQSLAPFAISVGEGLVNFIETMGEILKPVLATTANLLANAMDSLKAIAKIPEDSHSNWWSNRRNSYGSAYREPTVGGLVMVCKHYIKNILF